VLLASATSTSSCSLLLLLLSVATRGGREELVTATGVSKLKRPAGPEKDGMMVVVERSVSGVRLCVCYGYLNIIILPTIIIALLDYRVSPQGGEAVVSGN
jgi:hypothetical protein